MKPTIQVSKMPPVSIEAELRAIVADILDVDESAIYSHCRFREDLGADSLDLVTLIMAFGNVFEAEICDADVLHIQTVGEAITYLEKHLVMRVDQIE